MLKCQLRKYRGKHSSGKREIFKRKAMALKKKMNNNNKRKFPIMVMKCLKQSHTKQEYIAQVFLLRIIDTKEKCSIQCTIHFAKMERRKGKEKGYQELCRMNIYIHSKIWHFMSIEAKMYSDINHKICSLRLELPVETN